MEGALERGLVARGGGDAALARRGPAFSQIVRTHGRRREAAACGRWRRGRSRCKGRGRGWRRSNIYSLAALVAPRRQRVSRGEGQVPVTRCFGVLGPEVRLRRLRRRRCTQGHSLQRASRSGVWDRSRSGPGVQTHSSEDGRRVRAGKRFILFFRRHCRRQPATDCGTRPRKVCRPQFQRTQRASGLRPSRRSLPRGLHGPDRELDRYHALARTSATSATSTLSQRAERAAIYSSLRARAGRELAYVAVARLATPWTLLGTTDAPRRIGFPRLRAAALLSRS